MKFLPIILTVLLFTSCRGSVDQSILKPIPFEPNINDISGKWIADSFTYKMINIEKTDSVLPLSLVLNEDSSFQATNFAVVNLTELSSSKKNLSFSGTGKWKLKNINDKWALDLIFSPNSSFKKIFSQEYSIYLMDSRPVLLCFIGDPDQGKRVLLKKE